MDLQPLQNKTTATTPESVIAEPTMTRRAFLKRLALGGAGVLTAGSAGAWATQIEPEWIELRHLNFALPRLSPAFDGLRLAHLSDIHVSPWMTRERLMKIIQLVNAQQPDIVAITGDFISRHRPDHTRLLAETLSTLSPRLDALAVLGNHDHWANPEIVRKGLQRAGVAELQNSFRTFTRGGEKLHLCGVDDGWVGAADMSRVLSTLPSGGAAILLAHEPDFADDYVQTGRFDLQLSGHSHGGQVCAPFIGPLLLPAHGQKYPSGRYQVRKGNHTMTVYTNRGIGMVRPYVRFNCRPEITMITLRSGRELVMAAQAT